jgi:hypothetical protein
MSAGTAEETITIRGRAYQRPATLTVNGDTLTWRAQRGLPPIAENIATATPEVREVTWLEKRWSTGGALLAAFAALWLASGAVVIGGLGLVLAIAVIAWRTLRPRYWLGLDLGSRRLVLRVEPDDAAAARALVTRIERQRLTGEVPPTPPALP